VNIKEELFALQDISYGDFQAKLTPGIPRELFIGVRVPEVRKLAEKLAKESEASKFLRDLPHKYYDENSEMGDEAEVLIRKHRNGAVGTVRLLFKGELTRFLDTVDNDKVGPEQ